MPLPDSELDAQTSWARTVVIEKLGSLAPFSDGADFGAKRKLTVSFQRATAISKRVGFDDIDSTDFEALLKEAAERLRIIYEAQAIGRDVSAADQAEIEIAEVIKPNRARDLRQGIGLPGAARKAVERRAMEVAEGWLRAQGFEVTDCSINQPYDFSAKADGKVVKVEVKGTTSDQADAILMTRNEVELHRSEKGSTALVIVSKIRLAGEAGTYVASGGDAEVFMAWDITQWELEPTAFRLTRQRVAVSS